MDIIEAIQARTSVRTYDGKLLTAGQIDSVNAAMGCASCPLSGRWSMALQRFDPDGPQRPGTYGVIRGAGDFMLLGFDSRKYADAVAAGFAMEQVVLACTQMELGTCWMAGTFKAADFGVRTGFPAGMGLQAVIAVGHPAPAMRFVERVTRFTMGSRNRKPMERMFFVGDWSCPVTGSSRFYESLMMMRLAPSSVNSQPWRAVITGDTVHFYCKDANRVHMLDMGIGMSHFYMAERYRDTAGHWSIDVSRAPEPVRGMTYVASYERF